MRSEMCCLSLCLLLFLFSVYVVPYFSEISGENIWDEIKLDA